MSGDRRTAVFISYAHERETPAHGERVLALADRLRMDGLESALDQYNPHPPEGWPRWTGAQVRDADFVVMVCTPTYYRRVTGQEEPGIGVGATWEGRLIEQALYDAGGVSNRFVPVLFADGKVDDIPEPVRGFTHYCVDDAADYDRLCRHLTGQPETPVPEPGVVRVRPPKSRPGLAGDAPQPVTAAESLRAGRVFAGRAAELEALERALLPQEGAARAVAVCGVQGMAGVGKSYLADRFAFEHAADFPGGYVRIVQDPQRPRDADALIADVLFARGDLDEALRIRREEELPVYERLGGGRDLLVGRANMAVTHLKRGQGKDRGEAGELLRMALSDARRLELPEAKQIEAILRQAGLGEDGDGGAGRGG